MLLDTGFRMPSLGMSQCKFLFDKDKPRAGSWLRLYDIDTKPDASSIFPMSISFDESEVAPLYYAALSGFYEVANRSSIRIRILVVALTSHSY